jgi:hypothetical protein
LRKLEMPSIAIVFNLRVVATDNLGAVTRIQVIKSPKVAQPCFPTR